MRNGDRQKLARTASSRVAEAGLARRARIVLLAAQGLPHTKVARRAIRRGAFTLVKDLIARIGQFIREETSRARH